MKIQLVLFFLFIVVKGNSQNDSISLPRVTYSTEMISNKNTLKINITQDHTIYLNGKRVWYWDQVTSRTLAYFRSREESKKMVFSMIV